MCICLVASVSQPFSGNCECIDCIRGNATSERFCISNWIIFLASHTRSQRFPVCSYLYWLMFMLDHEAWCVWVCVYNHLPFSSFTPSISVQAVIVILLCSPLFCWTFWTWFWSSGGFDSAVTREQWNSSLVIHRIIFSPLTRFKKVAVCPSFVTWSKRKRLISFFSFFLFLAVLLKAISKHSIKVLFNM